MLIKNRLTLIFTLLATSIQLILSILAWYFYSIYREQEFKERLEDTSLVAGRLLISRRHLHDDFFKAMIKSDLLTIVDEQISIWDVNLNPVFTNKQLTDQNFFKQHIKHIREGQTVHFEVGHVEGTGLLYTDKGQQFFIFCAGYDRLGQAQLDNLVRILSLVNLVGFSLIVIAGWYFSNRALAPITTIIREVDTITHTKLSQRVNEGNRKDEIAQLAMTFNQMLLRLEEAFNAQSSFVAHASHELRTPLTNALGTLQTSIQYDHSPDELKASMSQTVDELKKLVNLTNSLLLLAKVQHGNWTDKTCQLDDCLLNAISQVKARYQERKISLILPPEYDQEFTISGNDQLLTIAVLNLLDNALKYSDQAIDVSLKFSDELIELVVSDQGKGISQQDLEHVFEPLYRGQNVGGITGFGIGLAVTKRIIELHGGQLTLKSAIDQGTTAKVLFPAAKS